MKAINRNQLFVANCLAFLVTLLSFGTRTGILNRLGVQFHLNPLPEIINVTLLIPIFLIVVFIGLNVYMSSRKRKEVY